MNASSSNMPPDQGKDVSHLYVFTNEKGGMAGYDKKLANDVIYEMSKGSKHLAHAQKQDEKLDKRIADMMSRLQFLTATLKSSISRQWDVNGIELEASRDLSRVCAVLDMDMFYAAVELQDRPDLIDQPMAVGGMGMLSTANYVARRYGVRSAMPGFIAKELCQRQGVELHIIPCNFEKYTKVSAIIKEAVDKFGKFHMYSLDEAFIDLTDEIKKRYETVTGSSNAKLDPTLPAVQHIIEQVTTEMRAAVTAATGLTCSCGVGPNFMLAKTAADVKKPDGQTITPWDGGGIIDWLGKLPIRKVGGVGKVLEKMLKAINVENVADVKTRNAEISHLFSARTAAWLQRVSLGLSDNTLSDDNEQDGVSRKSLSQERTFRANSNQQELVETLKYLANDVSEDMTKDERCLRAKTVTIKLKKSNFDVLTRAVTAPRFINKAEELLEYALPLLKKEFPCELRLMGLRVSNFEGAAVELPLGQQRLTKFWQKSSNRSVPRPLAGSRQATPVKKQKLDAYFNVGDSKKNVKSNTDSGSSSNGSAKAKEKETPKEPEHIDDPSADHVSVSAGSTPDPKRVHDFDSFSDCGGSSQGSWVDLLTQSVSASSKKESKKMFDGGEDDGPPIESFVTALEAESSQQSSYQDVDVDGGSECSWVEPPPTQVVVPLTDMIIPSSIDASGSEVRPSDTSGDGGREELVPIGGDPVVQDSQKSNGSTSKRKKDDDQVSRTPRRDRRTSGESAISPATNIKMKYESVEIVPESPALSIRSDKSDTKKEHQEHALVPVVAARSSLVPFTKKSSATSSFLSKARRASANSTASTTTGSSRDPPWTCSACTYRHLRLFEASATSCVVCKAPRPSTSKIKPSSAFPTENAAVRLARARSGKRPRSPGNHKITRFLKKK